MRLEEGGEGLVWGMNFFTAVFHVKQFLASVKILYLLYYLPCFGVKHRVIGDKKHVFLASFGVFMVDGSQLPNAVPAAEPVERGSDLFLQGSK